MKSLHLPPQGPAAAIIERHSMSRIPNEGAWCAVTHVSPDLLPEKALPQRFKAGGSRPLGNAILALVTECDFSALHRLRSEETWHFYDGDTLELLLLEADSKARWIRLGRDASAGELPQFTVPPGTWMGARPARQGSTAYSFFGCTLAPGFDYSDYEHGCRNDLQAQWPVAAHWIAELTRSEDALPTIAQATPPDQGTHLPVAATRATTLKPGAALCELIGRAAHLKDATMSVTRFKLQPGSSTGRCRYLAADEYFYILNGEGRAILGDVEYSVATGDLVKAPRGQIHELLADSNQTLEFLAVISPAFDPTWFVPEPDGPDELL